MTIIAVWAWFGHVGVAERALGLWNFPQDDPWGSLKRAAFGLVLALVAFAFWRLAKADNSEVAFFGLSLALPHPLSLSSSLTFTLSWWLSYSPAVLLAPSRTLA